MCLSFPVSKDGCLLEWYLSKALLGGFLNYVVKYFEAMGYKGYRSRGFYL